MLNDYQQASLLKKYDYLYTGTGPVSVIDGVIKSQDKKTVLFIDDKQQVGGAWVAIPVGKYGELEIGCHIWSYNKKGYNFLQSFLQLNLIDLNPQPYFLKGDIKISYDRKNLLGTLKKSVNQLARLKVRGLYKFYTENPSARLPLVSKKYQYPKGGARDIQAAIANRLEKSSAESLLSERIETLNKKEDVWEVTLVGGDKVLAKNIKLTSTSSISQITKGDTVIQIKNERVNYIHFHLVLDKHPLKPFSYIRLLGHDLIHRISDITYQLELNEDGHAVILVGVFEDKLNTYSTEGEVSNEILKYMKTKGYFSDETKVVYSQKNEFETIYIDPNQVEKIRTLDDNLDVLHTTDLIYGIHYREEEWSKAII